MQTIGHRKFLNDPSDKIVDTTRIPFTKKVYQKDILYQTCIVCFILIALNEDGD